MSPENDWNLLLDRLPTILRNALKNDEINNLDALCARTRRDILLIPYVGQRYLAIVERELARRGRSLTGQPILKGNRRDGKRSGWVDHMGIMRDALKRIAAETTDQVSRMEAITALSSFKKDRIPCPGCSLTETEAGSNHYRHECIWQSKHGKGKWKNQEERTAAILKLRKSGMSIAAIARQEDLSKFLIAKLIRPRPI